MFKLYLRPLLSRCKEGFFYLLSLFSKGISFESLALRYFACISSSFPLQLQLPAQLFFLYVFIHVYLFYILCASTALALQRGVKIRGDRLYPSLPGLKDKLTLWITSAFIFHWLSGFFLGSYFNWSLLTDWTFAIRPQINIKPQVKVLQQTVTTASSSCESCLSFSMEEPTTDLDVGLQPDHPATRGLLKNVRNAKRSLSMADNLYHAMAHDSRSWESNGSELDEEFQLGRSSQRERLDIVKVKIVY